jgi:hypothetical protein
MPRRKRPYQGDNPDEPGGDESPDQNQEPHPAHYSVGKGRPPIQSRFKPGQSGNPKGRRRKSRNMRTIVRSVLEESMSVREGPHVRRMSALEALVRTVLRRAFKGDPKSVAALIMLMRQFGLASDPPEAEEGLLQASDYQNIISEFLGRNQITSIENKEGKSAPPRFLKGGRESS